MMNERVFDPDLALAAPSDRNNLLTPLERDELPASHEWLQEFTRKPLLVCVAPDVGQERMIHRVLRGGWRISRD